jgi:hypothetical protein
MTARLQQSPLRLIARVDTIMHYIGTLYKPEQVPLHRPPEM